MSSVVLWGHCFGLLCFWHFLECFFPDTGEMAAVFGLCRFWSSPSFFFPLGAQPGFFFFSACPQDCVVPMQVRRNALLCFLLFHFFCFFARVGATPSSSLPSAFFLLSLYHSISCIHCVQLKNVVGMAEVLSPEPFSCLLLAKRLCSSLVRVQACWLLTWQRKKTLLARILAPAANIHVGDVCVWAHLLGPELWWTTLEESDVRGALMGACSSTDVQIVCMPEVFSGCPALVNYPPSPLALSSPPLCRLSCRLSVNLVVV